MGTKQIKFTKGDEISIVLVRDWQSMPHVDWRGWKFYVIHAIASMLKDGWEVADFNNLPVVLRVFVRRAYMVARGILYDGGGHET